MSTVGLEQHPRVRTVFTLWYHYEVGHYCGVVPLNMAPAASVVIELQAPLHGIRGARMHQRRALSPGSGCGPCRGVSSTAEAGCWAVQEAARAVVAAKVRGHYGGPAQTFEALERGLQARLARTGTLSAAADPDRPGGALLAQPNLTNFVRRAGFRMCAQHRSKHNIIKRS